MSDSTRAALRIAGSVMFVLGLLLFLDHTRSTGQSLETFRLILSPDAASIAGAAAALLAVVGLVWLHFREHKKNTTRHFWRHA